MTVPEVAMCADGHYRRVVYGLGPYIADYPEQALLACIVSGWCPRYAIDILMSDCFTDSNTVFRCTAHVDDLDGGEAGRRSHEHTDTLLEAFNLKVLWDDYGIVGDIVVSLLLLIKLPNCQIYLNIFQPFTVGFPRADIHELLSPDLLHQVIKGTFKDHLVAWVGEYLEAVHGKTRAKEILADIDRR